MKAIAMVSNLSLQRVGPVLPAGSHLWADYFEARWYAAYTCANHEKHVAGQLEQRAVEHFLPLYESVRRWKDRRARLHLPLFPGYVFVRVALRDRLQVLEIPSVVRLVGFGGLPTALPAQEIETLRNGLIGGPHAQPHPYLTVGRRVRISNGPLAGMEGILLRKKSNFRVVVSIAQIQRSFIVEVDAANLQPLFVGRCSFQTGGNRGGS
jgi:transcription termination/antitermination protein NusG